MKGASGIDFLMASIGEGIRLSTLGRSRVDLGRQMCYSESTLGLSQQAPHAHLVRWGACVLVLLKGNVIRVNVVEKFFSKVYGSVDLSAMF